MHSGPRTKCWSARARCRNPEREAVTSAARENLGRENLAEPLYRVQHLRLRQPRPLTAHDEVIDTEKLAIPSDLLPHRHLVADDEPIAREFLERSLRGA